MFLIKDTHCRMGGKGKASKLKHHGMSGIEEVAERRAAADAFNGGGIDRPNERARYQRRRRRRREGGREMGRPPAPPRPSLNLIVSIIGFSNTVM